MTARKRDIARDAMDAERAVLGAVMLDGSALARVATLTGLHWSTQQHAAIWATVNALQLDGQPTDAVTVGQRLDRVAMSAVIEMANNAPGSANIEAHAALVVKHWRLRQAVTIAAELRDAAAAGNDSGIDAAVAALMDLSRHEQQAEWSAREAMTLAFDQLQFAAQNPGQLRGLTSGLEELDECLGGFHPGDLIVLGARPAMGKTAGMLSFAAAASIASPVGIISAEQPAVQIAQRLLSQASKVAAKKLRTARFEDGDWPKVASGMHSMVNRNFWVFDRSAPDVTEIARMARKWKHKHDIKALYVDYLQRIEPSRGSDTPKHERVGDVARSLKNLARDLDIPVVALAQVKRDVETRNDKRPRMGDLSDSSDIEKEADQILMLYRDEVYNAESQDKGTAELLVEKNRHGPTGFVRVAWLAETMQLANLGRAA